ncbi:MAG TPA: hypothetical protein VIA81_06635 [Acidimicrobiia bacterium]|jgi:hypothetical protein
MSSLPVEVRGGLKRAALRTGYAFAVVINLAMLIIVQNILEWGWLPFLTEEFTSVVPWISLSLVVSIVANFVYQFNDTVVVKSTGQILVNLVSLFVTYQVFTVFPFDFSGSGFDWTLTARIVLILAMIGVAVGMLTEAIRLTQSAMTKRTA